MIRTTSTILRGAHAAVLAAAVAWCAVGCGSSGGSVDGADAALDPIEPVVRGAESGLEARLWAVEGRPGVFAAVLGEFGPPAGVDARQVEVWRRNGLRVVEVPLDSLDEVRGALPTIGPRNREWLGMLPEWVEVAKGPPMPRATPIRLDTGVAQLGPGRLRLMARCWATPRVGPSPLTGDEDGVSGLSVSSLMRVEVMPEVRMPRQAHEGRLGTLLDDTLSSDPGGRESGRSLALERLTLSWTSAGGSAVLIVPEASDADWSEPAPDRPETEGGRAREFGPMPPEIPTLGALTLTNMADSDTAGEARLVVVLVPRVPERFGVLPR